MKNSLILLVGLPCSGKSTWAKSSGYPIVCPDAIRLALHGKAFYGPAEPIVWATAKLMVASLFQAGHEVVVLDACNNTRKRRVEWIDERWDTSLRQFSIAAHICIERAYSTNRQDIIPIIERMAAEYELPLLDNVPYTKSTIISYADQGGREADKKAKDKLPEIGLISADSAS